MMILCIDLNKVSEKDSRLRVPCPWRQSMIVYLDSCEPSNAPIVTKMPRLLALAVHAFCGSGSCHQPCGDCFNPLPLLYLVAWVV
jgi:hypothetical protein